MNPDRCPFGPDHPHARGENRGAIELDAVEDGPSPRTWGEPTSRGTTEGPARTIPTHVGRTMLRSGIRAGATDHPHARGENQIAGIPRLI